MGFILRSLLVIGTFLGLLVLWSSLTPKDNRDNPFEKRVSTRQALSHTSVTVMTRTLSHCVSGSQRRCGRTLAANSTAAPSVHIRICHHVGVKGGSGL